MARFWVDFSGTVIVEAEDEFEAQDIVQDRHFKLEDCDTLGVDSVDEIQL